MLTRAQAEEKIKLGFMIHAGVYVIVVGGLMAMNFTRHPEKVWSLWVAGGWGLGVLLHAVNAFYNPHTREKAIERVIHRSEHSPHAH